MVGRSAVYLSGGIPNQKHPPVGSICRNLHYAPGNCISISVSISFIVQTSALYTTVAAKADTSLSYIELICYSFRFLPLIVGEKPVLWLHWCTTSSWCCATRLVATPTRGTYFTSCVWLRIISPTVHARHQSCARCSKAALALSVG